MKASRLTRLARELDSLSQSARTAEGVCRTMRAFQRPSPLQVGVLKDMLEAVVQDCLAVGHELEELGRECPQAAPEISKRWRAAGPERS